MGRQRDAAAPSLPQLAITESERHVVVVETVTNEKFHGLLAGADAATGNLTLLNVRHRAADLSLSVLEAAVVRGSVVRLVVLPPVLRNAPFLDPGVVGSRSANSGQPQRQRSGPAGAGKAGRKSRAAATAGAKGGKAAAKARKKLLDSLALAAPAARDDGA